MKIFFHDPDFDAEYARTLGKTYWGMADAGECFAAAAMVIDGDRASWQHAWSSIADLVALEAGRMQARGHRRSAGEAFGRAAEYVRQSYIFDRIDIADDPMLMAWECQRGWFRSMLTLLEIDWQPLSVPYAHTTLDGYLCFPRDAPGPLPTIVVPASYDAPTEEFWSLAAVPALRRGYAVAMYDGPGQGGSLFEKRLHLRPDWEVVSSAVVAQLRTNPRVDADRLVSFGRGMGGYLAPRAAACTDDFAACVADPGLADLGAEAIEHLPKELTEAILAGSDAACAHFDAAITADARQSAFYLARAVTHGLHSPSAFIRELQRYIIPVSQIRCPTLVTMQPGDQGSRAMLAGLTCDKYLVMFTDSEGAGGRLGGAGQAIFAQRVFDWLDDVIQPKAMPMQAAIAQSL